LPAAAPKPTALVAVSSVVADLRQTLRWNLIEQRGDELRGGKNLDVALGAPVALRAVEDAAGFGVVRDLLEGERRAEEILCEAAAAGGIVGGEGSFAGIDGKAAVSPAREFGDLPVGQGPGVAQATQDRVTPEFGKYQPAAGRHEVKIAVGGKHAGGGQHMDVGVPEEEVPKSLHGDDETRLAFDLAGALAEPGGDRRVSGAVEFAEQGTLEFERVSDQPGDSEHEVPVGHRGADRVGDEGALDKRAALVAGGAEAALLAREGEEEFVAAIGAVEAGEAGVEVAAVEEGCDGGGDLGGEAGQLRRVIVENLPDR
jgi:hypothetical protein